MHHHCRVFLARIKLTILGEWFQNHILSFLYQHCLGKILLIVILLAATFGCSLWVSSSIGNKALLLTVLCSAFLSPLCSAPLLSSVGQKQPFPTVPHRKAWTRWPGKIILCLTGHVPRQCPIVYTSHLIWLAYELYTGLKWDQISRAGDNWINWDTKWEWIQGIT